MFDNSEIEVCKLQERDICALCHFYKYPVSEIQGNQMYRQLKEKNVYGVYWKDELVGLIELHNSNEIGYRTRYQYQGKGYMKQGVALFLHYCKNIGLKQIYARVLENNLASKNILEYTGFLQKFNNDGVLIYVYDFEKG